MKINKSLKKREREGEREKSNSECQSGKLLEKFDCLRSVCVCVCARMCVFKMGRIAAWLCVDENSQQKGEETDAVGETKRTCWMWGKRGQEAPRAVAQVEDVVLGVHSKHPLNGEKQRKDAQDDW